MSHVGHQTSEVSLSIKLRYPTNILNNESSHKLISPASLHRDVNPSSLNVCTSRHQRRQELTESQNGQLDKLDHSTMQQSCMIIKFLLDTVFNWSLMMLGTIGKYSFYVDASSRIRTHARTHSCTHAHTHMCIQTIRSHGVTFPSLFDLYAVISNIGQ